MKREYQAFLPGFTASSSLADRLGHYRSRTGTAAIPAMVRTQMWGHADEPTRSGGCIPNCVCVGPDTCPCCGSLALAWPTFLRFGLFN